MKITRESAQTLLSGFEYVLVDEYQDIDARQYEMITHIARRAGGDEDSDRRAAILAAGDDDQSIYEWRDANVRFLRQFEEEFSAERHYLVENYRSTRHIIDASNALIAHNRDRMKMDHPIRVNSARANDSPGGEWEALDTFARGMSRCSMSRTESRRRVRCWRKSNACGDSIRARTGTTSRSSVGPTNSSPRYGRSWSATTCRSVGLSSIPCRFHEEERRLYYVAMTRARKTLTLINRSRACAGSRRNFRGAPFKGRSEPPGTTTAAANRRSSCPRCRIAATGRLRARVPGPYRGSRLGTSDYRDAPPARPWCSWIEQRITSRHDRPPMGSHAPE